MDLLAAFTLGLLGSVHCIGMCGPLVLAVPSTAQTRWRFFVERLLYNLGRTLTYGLMGIVLGLIGKSILVTVQQDVSIILGVIILVTVAVPFGLKSRLGKYSPLKLVYIVVKEKFFLLMKRNGLAALAMLGMLNGLLPCGLVYTALLGAAAVADAVQSALFMIVFGAGTIPALIAVALSEKLLSLKFRSLLNRAIPALSIALAILLILRGMNLGIPMVSPKVTHESHQTEQKAEDDCCK